ncbi:hypothetical protein LTR53_009151 [Teratosphaeriaceae sp. CCFEE 6253]|nr:hypothetical protein LTR53_009151 [Teratosphaeriaceae sp. CCFEE 6253]
MDGQLQSPDAKENSEQSVSPTLFGLPPELRNAIYTYALRSSEPIIVSAQAGPARPALLQQCKQITADATQIYYTTKSVRLCVAPTTNKAVLDWVRSLDRKTCSVSPAIEIAPDEVEATRLEKLSKTDYYAYVQAVELYPKKWRAFCRALLKAGYPASRVSVTPSKDYPRRVYNPTGLFVVRWLEGFGQDMSTEMAAACAELGDGEQSRGFWDFAAEEKKRLRGFR